MEFNVKLQELRKKKGLTQQELASLLYVSRTAVSKWESGRGYPSIDSLKTIADFFSVSVDELLSGDELLAVAEQNGKEKENRIKMLVYGLVDISVLLLFFLPLFGQKTDGAVETVSLIFLSETSVVVKAVLCFVVSVLSLVGVFELVLLGIDAQHFKRYAFLVSLTVNALGVLVFVACPYQVYAAVFLFVLLIIKALILVKRQ